MPPDAERMAEWGLKWLYDQKEVTVILSGMNSEEMVLENCRTASETETGTMTEDDLLTLEEVKQTIAEAVEALYAEAVVDGSLHYGDCFAAINNADGVHDCRNVTVNGGTQNLTILQSQYLVTAFGDVTEY